MSETSEVKKAVQTWRPERRESPSGHFVEMMVEDPRGGWVMISDYEKAAKEILRLRGMMTEVTATHVLSDHDATMIPKHGLEEHVKNQLREMVSEEILKNPAVKLYERPHYLGREFVLKVGIWGYSDSDMVRARQEEMRRG